MKSFRMARRRKWRRAIRAHTRRMAGKPALRLWQRFFIGPGAMLIDSVGSFFAWLRDRLHFRASRILPPLPPGDFLVIGHRGSPTKAVENTMDSFDRAIEEDHANAIETDLGVTRDRRVILSHDWDPDGDVAFARQAGAEFDVAFRPVVPEEGSPHRKPVCDLTLADLHAHWGFARIDDDKASGAAIPTIEELLAWARTKPTLKLIVLDVKVPDEQAHLMDVILDEVEGARKKAAFHFETLYMTTQPRVLERIRARIPGENRTFDVEIAPGLGRHSDAISCVEPAIRFGNNHASLGRPRATLGGWGIYRRVLTKDLRTIAARWAGADRTSDGTHVPVKRLICWTINRPREMRDLLNMGVHGVISDRPALLRVEADALLATAVEKEAKRKAKAARKTPPP